MKSSIAGLKAEAFEHRNKAMAVQSETGLFQESKKVEPLIKRIGVQRTDRGRTAFLECDEWQDGKMYAEQLQYLQIQ